MNWFERNAHWVMLALFVVLAYVTVGFLGLSAFALFAGALGGASPAALLADVAMVVALTAVLVVAEVSLAVGFVVTVVRRASFPTSDRLTTVFSILEVVLPPLRSLSLSGRFEPSVEERERAIKNRYVEGELTEREFEREMHDLLAGAEPRPGPVDRADPLDAIEPDEWSDVEFDDAESTEGISPEKRRESE